MYKIQATKLVLLD